MLAVASARALIGSRQLLPAVWQALSGAGYASAAGKVVELQTDAEYESALKELSAEKSAAMFDFGAAWCGPCKMIAPVFDGLAAEFPSIRFFKVDIDNDQLSKTVAANSVAAVPTFVSYVGADRRSTFSGADKAMLRKMAMELSAK
ncbi:hypothetical protein D9Q98_001082 [Chlorella vulgaris]|uniref:Thioredoxin domain-containing protein n=1 Tax=Chlorella vulgaris TaxID=3077 RepID=A0A9D4U0T0_CHLVU|nr:hypothetical protein D9Q98_001082 [Chlorella vulgaris]